MKRIRITIDLTIENDALDYWMNQISRFKNFFTLKFLHPADGEQMDDIKVEELKSEEPGKPWIN